MSSSLTLTIIRGRIAPGKSHVMPLEGVHAEVRLLLVPVDRELEVGPTHHAQYVGVLAVLVGQDGARVGSVADVDPEGDGER